MPIIRKSESTTLLHIAAGEPFRFVDLPGQVFVKASGVDVLRPSKGSSLLAVVLIIDSAQHETQDTYEPPGTVQWRPASHRVERLKLVVLPEYEVANA